MVKFRVMLFASSLHTLRSVAAVMVTVGFCTT